MPPKPRDVRERFWEKVSVQGDGECWLWQASLDAYRYGQFGYRKPTAHTMVKAHRMAYELLIGPIPEGHTIDHLCRVRSCVNPSHLEPVTCRENLLRGEGLTAQYARRTHCAQGHEFTEDNIYWSKEGARVCRTCSTQRRRDRYIREKSR